MRRGFTLIEVLLVVVIILIATAVAIPSFTKSFKGAKIRAATRVIVMSSRYARSVAVLQQVDTAVLYDAELGTVEIISIKDNSNPASRFLNEATDGTMQDGDKEAPTVTSLLKRNLEEGVRIVSVESEDSENGVEEVDGIYVARYYSNGMCDEYSVELEDDSGKRVRMTVDPLSGKSVVESL
jgi:prepilin-type N-terminal cleavage/methylation domain-containing protein